MHRTKTDSTANFSEWSTDESMMGRYPEHNQQCHSIEGQRLVNEVTGQSHQAQLTKRLTLKCKVTKKYHKPQTNMWNMWNQICETRTHIQIFDDCSEASSRMNVIHLRYITSYNMNICKNFTEMVIAASKELLF